MDLSRLCLHTMTNKPWTLDQCLHHYEKYKIGGISIWRNVIENQNLETVKKNIQNSGITPVSLVRGGFFTSQNEEQRKNAITESTNIIYEAKEIGCPLVVLVCGATPGQSVEENLKQIQDGIQALLPICEKTNVKLGIEPLHPMYADTRSSVSSLQSANRLAERINSPYVGVTIDAFHLWWEENLKTEIERCAENNHLFSFHICDWKTNMLDMLNDRGLMGDGVIPIKNISNWVDQTGFKGFQEVEVFSNHYWNMNQEEYLKLIIERYISTYKTYKGA